MIKKAVDHYLTAVHEVYSAGDARESSYYPILAEFIKKMWKILKKGDPQITIIPKKKKPGTPCIVIRDSEDSVVGYIEAVSPIEDLDKIQYTDRIKQYKKVYPNFILTNFLEFRIFRFGECEQSVFVGRQLILLGLRAKPSPENEEKCLELFRRYASYTYPDNHYAREVAMHLADRARSLRGKVLDELNEEDGNEADEDKYNYIRGFYQAFKIYLIHGLTEKEFADLYSQTLTFGLFTAATHCKGKFEREKAIENIPHTNGILHDVFEFVSTGKFPLPLDEAVNHIVELLKSVDTSRILNEYFLDNKGGDPILHFYETFLSEYDPATRGKRGVYYTPGPVVSFIVSSIHDILKRKLGKPDGLADKDIKILDPAAGTSTFLVEATRLATEEFSEKYGDGTKKTFVSNFLLNNIYGFEIMMAPYAVAHLKMAYMLVKMGASLNSGKRFNIYLTNTLEMEDIEQSDLPGMSSLSRESRRAGNVKKNIPVTVILGNPPYCGHSLTKSETFVSKTTKTRKTKYVKVKTWIGEKIEDYKKVDNKPLGEKNLKWLQDDYVKFIRFAQNKIDESGEGVVGFITNHGYLDNPTFRGMRQSLMNSFDEIYILDLHGNALKKEKSPDGSRDENIFDIRQGVAISLFIKMGKKAGKKGCRVFFADAWELRGDKYELLDQNDISTIEWEEIFPVRDFLLFKPVRSKKAIKPGIYDYRKFRKVTYIFPVHSVGIVTARDKLTIKEREDEVMRTVKAFSGADEKDARFFHGLGSDTRDWKIKEAQKDLLESGVLNKNVVPILYRPFDIRYTYYTGRSRGFLCMPRADVMRHMFRENVGLITVRQVAEGIFNHCLIADTIIDGRITSSNKGIGYLFPLYLYSYQDREKGQTGLFTSPGEPEPKEPNINRAIFTLLRQKAGFKTLPSPEQVFYYIYALLFSTIFREKYAEELKIDFPRIPFTSDYDLFIEMGKWGKRLARAHLLKSPELNRTLSKFEVGNSDHISKIRYVPPEGGTASGRIYINKTQYFSNITPDIWEYRLAGYQVMAKWLKSRKGRALTSKDIEHYIKIARSLQLTLQYQQQIDRLYSFLEKSLII